MANICDFCDKGHLVGNKVSHSNIKTKMIQRPNLKRIRVTIAGSPGRVRICTRCLRTGVAVKRARPASVLNS